MYKCILLLAGIEGHEEASSTLSHVQKGPLPFSRSENDLITTSACSSNERTCTLTPSVAAMFALVDKSPRSTSTHNVENKSVYYKTPLLDSSLLPSAFLSSPPVSAQSSGELLFKRKCIFSYSINFECIVSIVGFQKQPSGGLKPEMVPRK